MITSIKSFLENQMFLSGLSSFLFAQFIKAIISLTSSKKTRFKAALEALFWRTGGMPSSHASLVAALATSACITDGPSSNTFVITFFLALIVMRDAMGVRRSSGNQAKTLNQLGNAISGRFNIDYHSVKEVQGHTPLEVVVGALLGIFITAAYAYL
jgi:acid phosphatase family membrane protein YuiD